MSHEKFNFGVDISASALGQPPDSASYYGGTAYQLLIQLPVAATQVMIHFIHFNIGTKGLKYCQPNRTHEVNILDELSIHNGDVQLYGGASGQFPPDKIIFDITSSKDTLHFEFRSNSAEAGQLTSFSGFLLRYECKLNQFLHLRPLP